MNTLYQRILGDDFGLVTPILQEFHQTQGTVTATGILAVSGPNTRLGRLIAFLSRLPCPDASVPVRLVVTTKNYGEAWERWFATRCLKTSQFEFRGLLLESSFPWTFGFELLVREGGIVFLHRRTWLLGFPWPTAIAPVIHAEVIPTNLGWTVNVVLSLPFLGEMLRYQGEMVPS